MANRSRADKVQLPRRKPNLSSLSPEEKNVQAMRADAQAILSLASEATPSLLTPSRLLSIQRLAGNQAAGQIMRDATPAFLPLKRRAGSTSAVQLFTDEDIKNRAKQIWEKKGSPQQEKTGQDEDWTQARRELEGERQDRINRRAREIWQRKGSPQQDQAGQQQDWLQAEQEINIEDRIKDNYGISLDNPAGVQAITTLYTHIVPGKAMPVLTSKAWTLEELQDLERALNYYAPLLRAKSTDPGRPVTTFSRLEQGVEKSGGSIVLDPDTTGETFDQTVGGTKLSNISMFDSALDPSDFTTGRQQFRGTITHELSHALVEGLPAPGGAPVWAGTKTPKLVGKAVANMIEHFANSMAFWRDINTKSGTGGAEKPVTSYGKTNAQEDLAETMMFFFEEPNTLQTKCPLRFNFVVNNISSHLDPTSLMQVDVALGGNKDAPAVTWPGGVVLPWP